MGGSILERHTGDRITLDLTRDADAPGSARNALDAIEHGLDRERAYSVKLLISELVSNSVKYGGEGPVHVEIESADGRVRVEVIDRGPAFTPARRDTELETIGGWGFVLVEALASRWGSHGTSAHLWFEIDDA
jgi:anti-sigma regulatory factor (Ser/Thr protein kinase)